MLQYLYLSIIFMQVNLGILLFGLDGNSLTYKLLCVLWLCITLSSLSLDIVWLSSCMPPAGRKK